MALIDGEHYLPVIKDALDEIRRTYGEVAVAVFVGGTEKVTEGADLSVLGCPVVMARPDPVKAMDEAIAAARPTLVIDLSDEPIVGYRERMKFASESLARRLPYLGADFRFDPPPAEDVCVKPSLAVIGTGKRVGKTAVSAYACREYDRAGHRPCVVAMGRGGPAEPEVLAGDEIELTPEKLLEAARAGKHAASDYYEDALVSRIPTVGCRRCGGGLAGAPFVSNVLEGAAMANGLDTDFVIFEGSGSSLPPVATDARLAVVGAHQPLDYVGGYFGTYRLLISDAVVITGCEEPLSSPEQVAAMVEAVRSVRPGIPVIRTIFRPQPLGDIVGKNVFLAVTAPVEIGPALQADLEKSHGCRVVGMSHHLSNRPLLREDIAAADAFDVLLTELKAASVDVATEMGLERGAEVVYMDNVPVTVGGDAELSQVLADLAGLAKERFEGVSR